MEKLSILLENKIVILLLISPTFAAENYNASIMNLKTKKISNALFFLLISLSVYGQQAPTMSLKEVCRLAIANSKQLQLSRTETEVAHRSTQLEESSRTPSIDASLSATYIGNGLLTNRLFGDGQSITMPHFGNTFSVEASQVIFAGGAISNSIARARLQEQTAQLKHQHNELDLCFLITGYYLDLAKQFNQQQVLKKNIQRTELLIEEIKAKEKEGVALNNDVTRHELMMQQLKINLIEVDNNRKIISYQLALTLGLPDYAEIIPDSSVMKDKIPFVDKETLFPQALNNSPELGIAALNKQIANKEFSMAKSDYYPHLSLIAANQFAGPILVEVPTINKNFNYWYIGVGLKYNIASLFKNNRKVAVARTMQQIAKNAEAVAIENKETSLHSAYTKYSEAAEKITVYETSLRLVKENYDIIYNRYINGLVLVTEMIDASNAQLEAELAVVNARLDLSYRYYKLQRETGTKFY